MVGGIYDRRMTEMLNSSPEEPTYDNETLFNDLPEYTEGMKEATFMEDDIFGNEIQVWSDGEEPGTAELAIRFLKEDYTEEDYESGLNQEFYDQMGREHKSRTFATQEDYKQLGTEFHSEEVLESSEADIQDSETESEDYELVADGGEITTGQVESSFNYGSRSEIPWKNPGEPSNDDIF